MWVDAVCVAPSDEQKYNVKLYSNSLISALNCINKVIGAINCKLTD